MKKTLCLIACILLFLLEPHLAIAQVSTSNYQFTEYGFGTGGTEGMNTSSYSILGTAGDEGQGAVSTTNYAIGGGQPSVLLANVPAAPTITNPATNYDRLKVIIDTGNNPSDATYAIAISTDNFATTNYIQSDYTVGSTQTWLPYSGGGSWGGASGVFVTGLLNNTPYTIKVKARQGNFTESAFSVTASATTSDPSLTVSINTSSITFDNLNSGNSYTDNTKSTSVTTTSNATNGYTVYAFETQPLTYSSSTIADYASPNTAPTSWVGTGFGYTTSDTNLGGTGGINRFASGTSYAGFPTTKPGDRIADDTVPVTSELFTISYRITTPATQVAGTYTNTLVYSIVPVY